MKTRLVAVPAVLALVLCAGASRALKDYNTALKHEGRGAAKIIPTSFPPQK